jgi:hypothetical protein
MRCDPADEQQPGGTRLRLTCRLRPGLVQWLTTAMGFSLVSRALREQAQRAVDRAAAALSDSSATPGDKPKDESGNGPSHRRKRR